MINKIFISPFQRFIKIESFSGILLLFSTIIALIWANSPYAGTYHAVWQHELGFSFGDFELKKPLILWINDGLMAVFFFLIGLEIKREVFIGELNSMKKIAFPFLAAIGGMLVPVLFFIFLNKNPGTLRGWGIPMATDIAFSLAILKVLGDRIPLSLKLFLTAFAIVDDLGAVLVIAVFYSEDVQINSLIVAFILLGILYVLAYKGYFYKYVIASFGIIIWYLFLKAGIHPTIAGILLAFSIPVRQKIYTAAFIDYLEYLTGKIKNAGVCHQPILSKEQLQYVEKLKKWTDEFKSPLQDLEHKLHGPVAYFILPVFALANAGVSIFNGTETDMPLFTNIIIALVLGKSMGISCFVLLGKHLKIIKIPADISTGHILGVSFLAGIGFTMAIFIASLAFENMPEYLDTAKKGILVGSFISAVLGYVVLQLMSKGKRVVGKVPAQT